MARSSESEADVLTDTGERCLPWMGDTRVIYEHLHRYYFAQRVVAGLRVLDLGCGEGYGASILADIADEVVALDLDATAIDHARTTYSRENLRFEVASIEELDAYPDDSFDVIVCFEVLEHVENHGAVVAAVRRILRPGGLFLVSTPDRDRYNAVRQPNPFHVRELSVDELRNLLASAFEHQAIWTQHLAVGSVLRAVAPAHSGTHIVTVTRRDGIWATTSREDDYLVAAASERALPELPGLSLLVDRESSIIEDSVRAELRKSEERWSRTHLTNSAGWRMLERARRLSPIRRSRS